MIKETDRLAELISRDERMLDVIVESSPELRGLRNPITRRVMARLATVGQIARMAGLEPEILIRRIHRAIDNGPPPSGAEAPDSSAPADAQRSRNPNPRSEMATTSTEVPLHLADLPPALLVDLDVREDLRNGREPFSRIMAARAALPAGGVLRLRATFEPVPLYLVMEKQGYGRWTEQLAADDWRVWFHPSNPDGSAAAGGSTASAAPRQAAAPPPVSEPGANGEEILVLDVRGLEPPEPMVRTLAALESLPRGKTLLQINERVPQFLLPKLGELGFSYRIREQAEGVVRVFIRHADEV